jgi:hypothetical protein
LRRAQAGVIGAWPQRLRKAAAGYGENVPTEELVIKSRDDSGFLRLHSPDFSGDAVEYFTAELSVRTMHAEVRVYAYRADGLPDLFEEMASEWRGWRVAKRWESLEGELKLTATHDGLGHIALDIVLGEPYEEWKAQGIVVLDAGSLDTPARRLRDFIGVAVRET